MGADFTISPGRCPDLEEHTRDAGVVHIPGVVTPGEIIAARRAGVPVDPLALHFPNEKDGALGVVFVDAAVASSAAQGAWTNALGPFGS